MKLKDSIILILSVIIAIIVGVLIGVKLTEGKNDNPITNNENTNNGNLEIEKDFSLVEAEKLMTKYHGVRTGYIQKLTEDEKLAVVFRYAGSMSSKEVDCTDESLKEIIVQNELEKGKCVIKPNRVYGFLSDNYTNRLSIYSYNEVLKMKQELFGKNETLEKKDYEEELFIKYIPKMDSFFWTSKEGQSISNNIKITSAKLVNEQLRVYVNLDEVLDYWSSDEIVRTESNYEYIFKQEDNNYYLVDINQLSTIDKNIDPEWQLDKIYEKKDYDLKENLKSKNINFIDPLTDGELVYDSETMDNANFLLGNQNISVNKNNSKIIIKNSDDKEIVRDLNELDERIIRIYRINDILYSHGAYITMYNSDLRVIPRTALDENALPLIVGNSIYYGEGTCAGPDSSGNVKVYKYDLNTKETDFQFYLAHLEGWGC